MEISSSLTCSFSRQLPLSSSHSNFFSCQFKTQQQSSIALRSRRTEPVRKRFTCNAIFGLGVPELVVIAGVAALVFGPKKLPEVGRSIGKTVKSFQEAAKEFETELKKDSNSPPTSQEEQLTAVSQEKKQDANVDKSINDV
ncbi:sec-independent protein translocase protein TATA, chloroplastic-like [Rutidosis leptorrhynchoides]|uniref:sec-independent protein translocase protein TATA, chloroplastic-like n=1 Tax=Rutidosis leptorrhynchoides TaxID=125765 RepID=UPI003A99BA87